jgi:hypothetical protein
MDTIEEEQDHRLDALPFVSLRFATGIGGNDSASIGSALST